MNLGDLDSPAQTLESCIGVLALNLGLQESYNFHDWNLMKGVNSMSNVCGLLICYMSSLFFVQALLIEGILILGLSLLYFCNRI